MSNERLTGHTPENAERVESIPIPRTLDEKREFLKRLDAFRAYLKAKYGTLEDSVKILAMTRERDDECRQDRLRCIRFREVGDRRAG